MKDEDHDKQERIVTTDQRQQLESRLKDYQESFKNSSSTVTADSCSNIWLEFNQYHTEQVMNNCHRLFAVDDITSYVEIWRANHANNILLLLSKVFQDMIIYVDSLVFEDKSDDDEEDDELNSTWQGICDDSALLP